MANEHKSAQSPDEKFNFGMRELQAGARARADANRRGPDGRQRVRKAANEARGFDPYNTSGSFDRKKHWERVGKR